MTHLGANFGHDQRGRLFVHSGDLFQTLQGGPAGFHQRSDWLFDSCDFLLGLIQVLQQQLDLKTMMRREVSCQRLFQLRLLASHPAAGQPG